MSARHLSAVRAFLAIGLVSLAARSANADDAAEAHFVRRVAPLLQAGCQACHGQDPQKVEGGLSLRSRAELLRGGDSGESAIVPGQPEQSPLFLAVTRQHQNWSAMPPKEAEKLSAEQVAWIKQWILAAAPWPDEKRMAAIARNYADRWSAEDGVPVATSGGLSPEWTQRKYKTDGLWAYQPVRKPTVAQTGSAAIDELLAQRIPAGLPLAPPAEAGALLRRATFDLTGLPPSPEETAAFAASFARDAATAVAELIERLLASPHYGERMAQHWLDVVRYADSSGFANDFARGNAWRYRDYVVRSFNQDKPFDQFIIEQIAGDELDPHDPEKLIATGFLRMGPWELTGMEVPKIARQRFLDDVTNSVGETFLAHSLQCARCHDHKFDPVPTQDYYALQAVFATTQLAERSAPFLPVENTAGFEEQKYLELRRTEYQATLRRLDEKSLAAALQWYADGQLDPAPWQQALEQVRQNQPSNSLFAAARNLLLKQGWAENQFPPRMLGWTPEEIGLERIARKGLERLTWELDAYQPYALAVYNGRTPQVKSVLAPQRIPDNRLTQGELESTCILTGGDPFSSGRPVQPGVLSVLSRSTTPLAESISGDMAGRRLALARWIADARNPLTTRTIVNRVWLWHFGQPIAGNPNNFGSTGQRPTHPELLDWLSATLVENRWSIKSLHRLIMTSSAYRRSTEHPDRRLLSEHDPRGTSYAVFAPRRLSAEELRDAMLAITGELTRRLGGIPNRPEINLEAAMQPRQVMGTFAAAWTPNPLPEQRHRRSLYALKLRGLVDPAQEVFNAPAPDFSCERRQPSLVTPQVFALFNSRQSAARALALAARVLREVDSANKSKPGPAAEPVDTGPAGAAADAARRDRLAMIRCYQLVFGRSPQADELQACLEHWHALIAVQAGRTPPREKPPLEVRRDAVEENTGENFSFVEKLPAYADFVSDLQGADCDARTRALADVCLVFWNTHEFVYVY